MFSWNCFWLLISPLLMAISFYLNSQIPRTDNFYIPTDQDIFYKNMILILFGIWLLFSLLASYKSLRSQSNFLAAKPVTAWKYFSLFCLCLAIFSTIAFSVYSILFTLYGVLLLWLVFSVLLFVFWLVYRK